MTVMTYMLQYYCDLGDGPVRLHMQRMVVANLHVSTLVGATSLLDRYILMIVHYESDENRHTTHNYLPLLFVMSYRRPLLKLLIQHLMKRASLISQTDRHLKKPRRMLMQVWMTKMKMHNRACVDILEQANKCLTVFITQSCSRPHVTRTYPVQFICV